MNLLNTPSLLLGLALVSAPLEAAEKAVNTTLFGNLAVNGYDPVAYFTDKKPVEGSKQFAVEWNGATWRFASASHRDLFKAEPVKFAPQFGGYCAYAVSKGETANIDPKAWSVVNGKLYLNYDKEIQTMWEKDKPGYITKADGHWPKLIGLDPAKPAPVPAAPVVK